MKKNSSFSAQKALLWALYVPLFPFAYIADFVLFLATKDDCFNCGWDKVVERGVFCRVLLKELKK